MFTVTKNYRDLPAAHRQSKHDGHCRFIHGHNWGFDITFACDALDDNGFVVDVGKLQDVKKFLEEKFDHTLLLNLDDPEVGSIQGFVTHSGPLCALANVVLVPNCGMEGLAKLVFMTVTQLIDRGAFDEAFERNLRVVEVVCWEDSKNRATYRNGETQLEEGQ